MDFHQTWCVHWYCGDLLWDCWWANFINFWQLSPLDMSIFSFLRIILVNINGFSPNLVHALILCVDICFGIANGQISSILTELSACNTSAFHFQDNNFSKSQWIFTKFDICIDIVEICFGIVHWQILAIFDRVISPWHDNGRVLLFHVLFFSI